MVKENQNISAINFSQKVREFCILAKSKAYIIFGNILSYRINLFCFVTF